MWVEVDVSLLPINMLVEQGMEIPSESLETMRMVDDTRFVQDVIASAEEDCWNEL